MSGFNWIMFIVVMAVVVLSYYLAVRIVFFRKSSPKKAKD